MKTFFFLCLFGFVPLPHSCAAALCASTLLPNWTLDKTNKFVICATSRGAVLPPKEPNGCKNVLFFMHILDSYPCRTIVRRHFVPRHFFRIGRLIKQINLPSALLHRGPFFRQNAKMDVKSVLFLCLFLARTPAAHLCGGITCHNTSSRST